MDFVELELEAKAKLEDLKRHLGIEAIKLQGRRPSGLKAVMIYILARERGFDITRGQLAETYGISEQALILNTKLLKRLMHNPARNEKEGGSKLFIPHVKDVEEALRHVAEEAHPEVVKPETLAKWRQWGVPEEIIEKTVEQRRRITETRQAEEWITLPHFAYKMPRLPEIEANAWGFAKAIDFEGTIIVRDMWRKDKITKIDRWLYRYEHYQARITIETRTYEPIEEMANMMHTAVRLRHSYDTKLKKRMMSYSAAALGSRAVRTTYLIEPHLTIPEKKRRATEILTIYREKPSIKTS